MQACCKRRSKNLVGTGAHLEMQACMIVPYAKEYMGQAGVCDLYSGGLTWTNIGVQDKRGEKGNNQYLISSESFYLPIRVCWVWF